MMRRKEGGREGICFCKLNCAVVKNNNVFFASNRATQLPSRPEVVAKKSDTKANLNWTERPAPPPRIPSSVSPRCPPRAPRPPRPP